jgi:LuxR family quorum-sensing system transcriptional regulator CciR
MRRLVDRFAEDVGRCRSLDELHDLLARSAHELGFTYFALVHHAALTNGASPLVRLDNYPADWVERLEAESGRGPDPVHAASRRASCGFAWNHAHRLAPLKPWQRARFAACRSFGLGDGFTVPINVPGEPAGSCSFAVKNGERLPRNRLRCAELVGLHAFAAARRLAGSALRPQRPHLSPRERQCLQFVALGKSDWEISVILGISVETARQYVKRARRAYDVVSRTQLVVLGLRDDWLDIGEAIPPAGGMVPPTSS